MAIEDWSIDGGCYTGAFFQWCLMISNLRGYFKLATEATSAGFQELWSEAVATAPPEADAFDAFADTVDILPTTFEWLLRSTVIITLVSAFDAYVLEAIDEVQQQPGRPALIDLESKAQTQWHKVWEAYEQLVADHGPHFTRNQQVADPDITEIEWVRSLRHVLVHRSGKPATSTDRAMFAAITDRSGQISLDDALVIDCFGKLDSMVMAMDPLIWAAAHDRQIMPERYPMRRWEVG